MVERTMDDWINRHRSASNQFTVTTRVWRLECASNVDPCETQRVGQHTRTGSPLCAHSFLNYIEALTGRMLQVRKAGEKAEGIAARSYS